MKYEVREVEDEKKLTVDDLFPKLDNNLKAVETFYDADGNKTDSIENAVRSVTRFYDENGKLVREDRGVITRPKAK